MGEEALGVVEDVYEERKTEIESRKREAEGKGKKYYTPFAIGQEADETPARTEQIDILAQTLETWLSGPLRIFNWLQQRILGSDSKVGANYTPEYDGCELFQVERGRYPLRLHEVVIPEVACYNFCDRIFKSCGAYSIFHVKDTLEGSTNYMANILCVLFDVHSHSAFTLRGPYRGFRSAIDCIGVLGAVVRTAPGCFEEEQILWEEMKWKKADINHIKANIWLIRNPTLIRAKKAEIKKIKADNWIYRKPWEISWPRWKYREIWSLKEEIKKLKAEGRGKERIREIQIPKEYAGKRRYLYPHILYRETVELKSKDDYKKEIEEIKKEIREMKEKRKALIKRGLVEGKKWLQAYREYKRKRKENEKTPRIRKLMRKWKEGKKWIIETSKIKDLSYRAYKGGRMSEEMRKIMGEFYISSIDDYEREHYQEIRGDPWRESVLSDFALGKLFHAETIRFLGNHKGEGFGRTMRPSTLAELICRESRGDYDFNTHIFRTHHFNRGIGEWKELPKFVRKKIPFPLVYRPIKDKYGYTVGVGEESRWECRPLHPADAWFIWGNDTWRKIYAAILWPFSQFLFTTDTFCKSGEGYTPRPFDRWHLTYSPINRLLIWVLMHT